MPARPTIGDVAARAGVSVATVSRALRGLENVNPDTRRKVEEAASALEYVVDSRASSLASGRTNTIGLVAPLFHRWYASQTAAGLERALAVAGMDLLVYSIDIATPALPVLHERFRGRRVDGIVFVDVNFEEAEFDGLKALEVPLVTIGSRTTAAHSLTIDEAGAIGVAVDHLVGLGHHRLGYVGGKQPRENYSPVNETRELGVRSAMAAAGLDPDRLEVFDGGFSSEGGQRVLGELLERPEPMPTALVCGSDEMAMGVLAEAWHRGVDTPESLSVVGFDGHELASLFGLTTVGQPVREKGALAAELILGSLRCDGGAPIRHVEVPVELLVRRSTAPPAGA